MRNIAQKYYLSLEKWNNLWKIILLVYSTWTYVNFRVFLFYFKFAIPRRNSVISWSSFCFNQIKLNQLNCQINTLFNAIILKIYFDTRSSVTVTIILVFIFSTIFIWERKGAGEIFWEKKIPSCQNKNTPPICPFIFPTLDYFPQSQRSQCLSQLWTFKLRC